MENEDKNLTNVNSAFMNSIFKQLEDLKRELIVCRLGYANLLEIIQVNPGKKGALQFEHLKLLTTGYISLLNDAKSQVSKEYFNSTMKYLESIKIEVATQGRKYLVMGISGVTHKLQFSYITPYGISVIEKLEELRSQLVGELKHLLFATAENKLENTVVRK